MVLSTKLPASVKFSTTFKNTIYVPFDKEIENNNKLKPTDFCKKLKISRVMR